MIRHFVLLRFNDNVSATTKASLFAELQSLRQHIDGIEAFHCCSNVSIETSIIHGFMDGFWFDFRDEQVRATYLADPIHQAIGAKIVAHTLDGPQGVVVFDITL